MNYLQEIQHYISHYLKLAVPNSQLVRHASTLADQFAADALKRLWVIDQASTGFARELTNRAGGLAGIKPLHSPFHLAKEDLVIAADHGLEADHQVNAYSEILNCGASLLLIGSKNSAVYQSITPSLFLDNTLEAAPAYLSDQRFCPIDTTLNITIVWCFIAEWLNACVLRGYTPVINASAFRQGGAERVALYRDNDLFHSKGAFAVTSLPPGTYSRLYLQQLSNTLDHIIHTQAPLIEQACAIYRQALSEKGSLFLRRIHT